MVKIALIKKDGTWEEMHLRIKVNKYSTVGFPTIHEYLRKKKFLTESGEYPEGVIGVSILPLKWDKACKS